MKYTCPNCKKPLANRARPKCLYCDKPVPAELLFSPIERRTREQKLSQERQQYELHDRQISQLKETTAKRWWQFWRS
ncbi:hypothetical protein [Candidatus Cyanaurora vandensis]|uniref:hypothetical protein n=1 Tax=Candidatus Cyanaurora vandensis TaxID=2714958 RepID=UPI00257B435B|nr:hypothetical protein [Candidatus Cyanaurora vandensis]